jgi:hypothetical protein
MKNEGPHRALLLFGQNDGELGSDREAARALVPKGRFETSPSWFPISLLAFLANRSWGLQQGARSSSAGGIVVITSMRRSGREIDFASQLATCPLLGNEGIAPRGRSVVSRTLEQVGESIARDRENRERL